MCGVKLGSGLYVMYDVCGIYRVGEGVVLSGSACGPRVADAAAGMLIARTYGSRLSGNICLA